MKPKLLIAADTYTPQTDGVMRFLEEVAPRLIDYYDITLLVPGFGKKKSENFLEQTIRVIKLPTYKKLGLAGYPSIKINVANLRLIKAEVKNADIVWAQDLAGVGLFALRYARRFGKKSACFVHQILWEQAAKVLPRFLEPLAYRLIKKLVINRYNHCQRLLVPYATLIDQLKTFGVTVPMSEVRLGVNTHTFIPPENKSFVKHSLGFSENSTIIGYVGRVSKEKNTDTLQRSFESLRRNFPDARLLIVGGGRADLVEHLHDTPHVKVTGFVRNVVPYLQAMDIFVMPSLTETTSLATLEAMSCGLPVVATRVGFQREYIQKGQNGLTFEKGNQTTLTLQLGKLLANPELRQRMGVRARHIAHSFSWDKTAEKIRETL